MLSSASFHSDFKSWHVSTHEVGVIGVSLEQSLSLEALSALIYEKDRGLFGWAAKNPHSVHFKITQEGTDAFKLELKGVLRLFSSCTKCLEEIEHEIDVSVSMRLLEQTLPDQERQELLFDSDALEDVDEAVVGYFYQKSIDLGLILREQIFLSVPDYPHCGIAPAVKKEACERSFLVPTDDKPQKNPFMTLLNKN